VSRRLGWSISGVRPYSAGGQFSVNSERRLTLRSMRAKFPAAPPQPPPALHTETPSVLPRRDPQKPRLRDRSNWRTVFFWFRYDRMSRRSALVKYECSGARPCCTSSAPARAPRPAPTREIDSPSRKPRFRPAEPAPPSRPITASPRDGPETGGGDGQALPL